MDVDRLAAIAQQFVARVREDDPAANQRWLYAMTTPAEREALLYVIAAAVPTDRKWSDLTLWTLTHSPVDKPVDRSRFAVDPLVGQGNQSNTPRALGEPVLT